MMYYISKLLLELMARVLFHVKVYGRENLPKPPYIIVSNHASYVDPPLVGMLRRWNKISFMAKRELFETTLSRLWFRAVCCIEVDRDRGVAGLRTALNVLKKGGTIGVFPEGTRSTDGNLQEAKNGVGFLILKARVPVVPVYIKGTQNALPKTGGVKYGTPISVHAGEPISPEEFLKAIDKKDYAGAVDVVMKRVAELKELSEKH